MDQARSRIDNQIYTARQFNLLPPEEKARLRHDLECLGCQATAYFRGPSASGQSPCFGARPHAEQCDRGAPANAGTGHGLGADRNPLENPARRIVIDLIYGANEVEHHNDENLPQDLDARGGRFAGNGERQEADAHRRPHGLLRELLANDEFATDEFLIELPGRPPVQAAEFFRKFADADLEEQGEFKAYWGGIVTAVADRAGTIWLNTGGRGQASVPLTAAEWLALRERYQIDRRLDVHGAHALVFGELHSSERKRMFITAPNADYIYLILARR